MTFHTAARELPCKTRPEVESRRVVWVELPQDRVVEPGPREPWYDLAALHEEPERWDGMA